MEMIGAFEAWMDNLDAFYVLGSAVGSHPYPSIVHEFQKVISEESRRQILEKENRLPDMVIACVSYRRHEDYSTV